MPANNGRAATWNVCLDFGTAFSKAAAASPEAWNAFDPAHLRPLAVGAVDPHGNPFLLESALFVGDTHISFGSEAVRLAGARTAAKRQALRSFKTLLSVPDLDQALETKPPRSIDPHRIFRRGDLIVLYLAYLMRATEKAVALDPMLAGVEIKRRYALPAWRGVRSMHGRIARLFAAAKVVGTHLGDALFAPGGVPIEEAATAVKGAQDAPELDIGMIFEATAAASCCLVHLDVSASHLIVVDMGAGTTDIAALARRDERFEEVSESRVTLKQAGDLVDQVLLDIALEKAAPRDRGAQAELWRTLLGSIQEIKESLFLDGQSVVTHRGTTIVITMRDLKKDADFNAFVKQLQRSFDLSLSTLAARALRDKSKSLFVIAVGGGAEAPFIKDLVRKASARRVRTHALKATPNWAHAAFGGNLAPIFPQLAIAIGGALAPDTLLAAASHRLREADLIE